MIFISLCKLQSHFHTVVVILALINYGFDLRFSSVINLNDVLLKILTKTIQCLYLQATAVKIANLKRIHVKVVNVKMVEHALEMQPISGKQNNQPNGMHL